MNDDNLCQSCNGTGEGQVDGSTCYTCKGSGVARDYKEEEEAKAEAADYWNDERLLGVNDEQRNSHGN